MLSLSVSKKATQQGSTLILLFLQIHKYSDLGHRMSEYSALVYNHLVVSELTLYTALHSLAGTIALSVLCFLAMCW